MSLQENQLKDSDIIEQLIQNKTETDSYLLDTCEVVEEYEVTEQEKIKILNYEPEDEYIYYIDSPKLNQKEYNILKKVMQDVEEFITTIPIVELSKSEILEKMETKARQSAKKYIKSDSKIIFDLNDIASNIGLKESEEQEEQNEEKSLDKIIYYALRNMVNYERLTPVLEDQYIEDISCNGPQIPVFIYHNKYGNMASNIIYESKELDLFVSMLAQKSNKHISVASPSVAGRLEEGHRVQLTLSNEISPKGSNYTIRKFTDEPFTPVQLIDFETFSLEQMAYLWLAIENNKSLIFAGGTASGKTTSMNAISQFIPSRAKVVTIEDTQEIVLQHRNWIQGITRESFGDNDSSEINMYSLLRDALRQRPEYIIVGEVRGKEAQTLFQAMNTGHTTYSTMHAENVKSAVNRLEHEPINLPRQMLTALDIISVQVRLERDGQTVRRCKELVEIGQIDAADSSALTTKEIFNYNPRTDNIDSRIDKSDILQDIKEMNNWSDEKLKREFERRKKLLLYLKDHPKQLNYKQVTKAIRKYSNNSELKFENIIET